MPTTSLSNSNDKFYRSIWNDIIFGNDGHDTIFGDWGYDQIYGGKGNDVLDGSLGNDLLMGQEGDDYLATSDSAEMHGGTGNDSYRIIAGGSFKPKIVEHANEGIDTVRVSIWRGESYTLGANLENLSIQDYRWVDYAGPDYSIATRLNGNSAENVITGGAFADALYGHGGNDTLRGGGGRDALYGGANNDLLEGGADSDTMEGGSGNDIYRVEQAGDQVVERWGEGTDWVQTTLSTYTLGAHVENLRTIGSGATFSGYGNALDNYMYGAAKSDYMFGGAGEDVMHLGSGRDYAWGQGDDDYLNGQSGEDMLSGGDGADCITGGSEKDDLRGDGGDDIVKGDDGDDVITGGTGLDLLWGGAGKDRFVFNSVKDFKQDSYVSAIKGEEIQDFAKGDLIDLSWSDANSKLAGNQAFKFFGAAAPAQKTAGALWTFDDGADLIVLGDVDGDGWQDFGLRLNDVQSLSATDFLL